MDRSAKQSNSLAKIHQANLKNTGVSRYNQWSSKSQSYGKMLTIAFHEKPENPGQRTPYSSP